MLGLKKELCVNLHPTALILGLTLHGTWPGMLLLCNEWKNLELFKPQENV